MTNIDNCGSSHVDDGDIIRWLDVECDQQESERISGHIDGCSECRKRVEDLESASKQFSLLMASANDAPSASSIEATIEERTVSRWSVNYLLRVAAVFAVVVLVFSATPARAWIVRGWEKMASLVTAETESDPASISDAATETVDVSSVVSFTPREEQFRLEFLDTPTGGELTLIVDTSTSASAMAYGETNSSELIVLPNGLRIVNAGDFRGDFEVRLPSSLASVVVVVEGRTVLQLDPSTATIPFRRVLDLSSFARE